MADGGASAPPPEVRTIALCMLQGARHSHITALDRAAVEAGISVEVVELRTEDDLSNTSSWIDAVVLPGGESTTMRLTGGPVEAGGSGLLPALFAFLRERPAQEPSCSAIHRMEDHL